MSTNPFLASSEYCEKGQKMEAVSQSLDKLSYPCLSQVSERDY